MSGTSDSSDAEIFDEQDDKDPFCDDSVRRHAKISSPQDVCQEYTGPIISGHRFDKKLVCVKYPGNVINVDKAIETLGGICSISTAIDAPNRRLELRFRPDDGYSKPACGDRHSTTGFLLRVRIKKDRVRREREATSSKSVDITNSEFVAHTSCVIHEDKLVPNSSKNEQTNDLSNSTDKKSNCAENTVNLIDQEENSNVNSVCTSIQEDVEMSVIDNIKDSQDTCVDMEKSSPNKKNSILPTFDNNKYENWSQDADYDLPCLKVLGKVDTEFRFTNLCDFQYIPMTQNKSDLTKLECIYSSIYPTGIPSFSWLKNDVPYFLPPAAFSRMDSIQQYVPKTEVNSNSENIIGKNKKCQAGFPNYIYFSTPEVPTTAPKGIETAMKVKFLKNTHLEQVRQLFEDRPIWSKNAIMHKTQFTSEQLKILLPSVAFYFMTGPWRIMWVKLGYDPRKDINARKYQTLDYRLKAMHGLGLTIKCKRNYSTYTLPYKSTPVSKSKAAVLTATLSPEQNPRKERHLHENVYIYREGMIPPSRQMFYQYCDILVGEIQQMLAKLPDPLPGIRCHEKRGWLPSGFDVQCREIINKQVRAILRKKMNIPEDHPTSLPRKRKCGIRLRTKKTKKNTVKSTESQSNVSASTSELKSNE